MIIMILKFTNNLKTIRENRTLVGHQHYKTCTFCLYNVTPKDNHYVLKQILYKMQYLVTASTFIYLGVTLTPMCVSTTLLSTYPISVQKITGILTRWDSNPRPTWFANQKY